MRFEFRPLPLPPPVEVGSGSVDDDETTGFFLSPPAGGVVGLGRAGELVTTLPPLPPFFPPLSVGTGRSVEDETTVGSGMATSVEVFGFFPPFAPLSVGEGAAGELEETSGRLAVGSTTSLEAGGIEEDETELASCPPSVTVIWRGTGYQHYPNCCDKIFLT